MQRRVEVERPKYYEHRWPVYGSDGCISKYRIDKVQVTFPRRKRVKSRVSNP